MQYRVRAPLLHTSSLPATISTNEPKMPRQMSQMMQANQLQSNIMPHQIGTDVDALIQVR
jgi:hypothetical protein